MEKCIKVIKGKFEGCFVLKIIQKIKSNDDELYLCKINKTTDYGDTVVIAKNELDPSYPVR